jgi:hypothetical protein
MINSLVLPLTIAQGYQCAKLLIFTSTVFLDLSLTMLSVALVQATQNCIVLPNSLSSLARPTGLYFNAQLMLIEFSLYKEQILIDCNN